MLFRVFSTGKKEIKTATHQKYEANATQENVYDKIYEILVISLPDAIIDPWAVMIHLEYTFTTFWTVMSSLRLPLLVTFGTVFKQRRINIIWHFNIIWYQSWISKTCPNMWNKCHHTKKVENNKVQNSIKRQRKPSNRLQFNISLWIPIEYAKSISTPLTKK